MKPEYDAKDGGLNQHQAQLLFLQLLEKHALQAICELKEKPFKAFVAANLHLDSVKLETLKDSDALKPELSNFIESLETWAQHYNLRETWLLNHFTHLFGFWQRNPKFQQTLLTAFFTSNAYFPVTETSTMKDGETFNFDFSFRGFRFNEESEISYRKEVKLAFKEHLKSYLAKVDKHAKQFNKRNTKTRRSHERTLEDKIELFIKFQVEGIAKSVIVSDEQLKGRNLTQQSFVEMLDNLALDLQINLRREKG